MADVAAPASANTVGTLLVEMAAVLAPALGADAAREARELLAALHDMPRHWPTVEHDQRVSTEEWLRAIRAAKRRARGAPLQYGDGSPRAAAGRRRAARSAPAP